jgi:hypothetical protein
LNTNQYKGSEAENMRGKRNWYEAEINTSIQTENTSIELKLIFESGPRIRKVAHQNNPAKIIEDYRQNQSEMNREIFIRASCHKSERIHV